MTRRRSSPTSARASATCTVACVPSRRRIWLPAPRGADQEVLADRIVDDAGDGLAILDHDASMTPNSGTPEAKLKVPSTGSTTKARSASPSRGSSAGSSRNRPPRRRSSPRGSARRCAAVMTRSALTSASVTRSAAEVFWRTSPSPSRRKRGMISADRRIGQKPAEPADVAIVKCASAMSSPAAAGLTSSAAKSNSLRSSRCEGLTLAERADHRVLAARHAALPCRRASPSWRCAAALPGCRRDRTG